MRYRRIIKSSLLFVILSLLITACGGSDTTTLNGTMTVQTRAVTAVAGLQAQDVPVEPGWLDADLTTRATANFEAEEDGTFLDFQDFFGNGAFGADVQRMVLAFGADLENFTVTLDPSSTSGGTLGDTHDILLNLVVGINGQQLTFNNLQLVGAGSTAFLGKTTDSQPYVGSDGSQQELRIQSAQKDVSTVAGPTIINCETCEDCVSLNCDEIDPIDVEEGKEVLAECGEDDTCQCIVVD